MGQADNGIAAFDMVIKKIERFAGNMSFQPKRHFAKFHSQRVFIHTVNAVFNGVTDATSVSCGRRLVFSCADAGQIKADAPCGIEQNMAAACRHIANPYGKKRFFFVRLFEFIGNHVIKGMPYERLAEFIRCVMRARGGTLGTLGKNKPEAAVFRQNLRRVFQKPLIDGTEFFRIECGVIDPYFLAGFGMNKNTQVL